MDLSIKTRRLFLGLCSLIFVAGCSAQQSLSCTYVPMQSKDNPYPELTEFKNCGQLESSGTISVNDSHIKQIWFNDDGLADIRIHDGIYYINKKGKLIRTHLFDNGADEFKEGLARTIKNNQFGFINKNLDTVIKQQYDFALPFNNGQAVVCNGCQLKPVGEHKEVSGGLWGVIDKQDNVVIEIKYNSESLSLIRQAKQIRLAINNNNIDQFRAFSELPLTLRNQEWESAKDGSGFVVGAVTQASISSEADFTKAIPALLTSVHIEGEKAITDITLDMFTTELGKDKANWATFNLVLFKRGEGDVEHIVLMGLNKTTHKLNAIYIN